MKLSTPSFKRLLSLAALEGRHSEELFYTIQRGNEQTAEIREHFIKAAKKLDDEINKR